MSENDEPSPDAGDTDWEWAIVEVFGHRRHAGRTREEERFGAKLLRIDVPVDGDPAKGWKTIFYGGASIFSFTLSDEATVRRLNKPYDRPAIAHFSVEVEEEGGDRDEGELTL